MSKTIRVDETTHADLARLKAEDESFDDVISRLLDRRRADIEAGAGYWSSDEADAAREQLRDMKEGVGAEWSS